SFTLTVSSGSPTASCLQGTGPLITLSGVRTAAYQNTSLADNTRIDASTAQILTADLKAVTIGGGSNLCFSGGDLLGQQPPSTAWSTMHSFNGIYVRTVKPSLHIENTRVLDSDDGVSMDRGSWPIVKTTPWSGWGRDRSPSRCPASLMASPALPLPPIKAYGTLRWRSGKPTTPRR